MKIRVGVHCECVVICSSPVNDGGDDGALPELQIRRVAITREWEVGIRIFGLRTIALDLAVDTQGDVLGDERDLAWWVRASKRLGYRVTKSHTLAVASTIACVVFDPRAACRLVGFSSSSNSLGPVSAMLSLAEDMVLRDNERREGMDALEMLAARPW